VRRARADPRQKDDVAALSRGAAHAERGSISIAGVDVTYRSPADRDLAKVFQNLSLYPRCHHTLRREVTPSPAPEPGLLTPPPAQGDQQCLPLDSPDPEAPRSGRARWGWLIGHVFRADVEHCARCGGPMRWVEPVTGAEIISRLLAKHPPLRRG
jgi:hypothetical protein